MSRKRMQLTLEERLSLAAGAPAESPRTAAKLLKDLSQVPMDDLFRGGTGFDDMRGLVGEYVMCPDEETLYYSDFCRRLQSAFENENDSSKWPRVDTLQGMDPYRLAFGAKANNAIVLLGKILLDHVHGIIPYNRIYNCTRMTLGQYMDALTDLSFREDASLDRSRAEAYSTLKDRILDDYRETASLEMALGKMIRCYEDAWQEFNHLDFILRCMGGLSAYLEANSFEGISKTKRADFRRFRSALCRHSPDLEGRELVDQDRRYFDPCGYYFTLANEYQEDMPELPTKTLYSKIFIADRDYHPEVLKELAALCPAEDLRALLEKTISGGRLPSAMQIVNKIVFFLYALLFEPYLQIDEYHYEEHLETRPP